MMGTYLALAAAMALQSAVAPDQRGCNADVQAFLACNNPRVVAYLSKLTARDIGSILAGVELSDGSVALKGSRFRGRVLGLEPGSHVFVVERARKRTAYAWVDASASPLPVPECPAAFPAAAYVLSGDAYTWKDVQPGHGVVEFSCVDARWKIERRELGRPNNGLHLTTTRCQDVRAVAGEAERSPDMRSGS